MFNSDGNKEFPVCFPAGLKRLHWRIYMKSWCLQADIYTTVTAPLATTSVNYIGKKCRQTVLTTEWSWR